MISKNSFEFLKFFVNLDTAVTYHNLLREVYVIHTSRKKMPLQFSSGILKLSLQHKLSSSVSIGLQNLRHLHPLLLLTLYSIKTPLGWHLYSAWCSSLTFFLGSMSKGFRVLMLGNSVSDSELLKEMLELLSAML